MERKHVPTNKYSKSSPAEPDNAHVMLAVVMLSLIGTCVMLGLIAIFWS